MKIMIAAGEVSGDIHAAYLVRELKKIKSNIYFLGMGSEKLLAEGVDIKIDLSKRGTIGIFEALPNALPVYLAYKKMVALMKAEKPNLLILVDSQGVNMPLAKAAKKLGIKTIYYIAPQEWLWGTAKGVKKVAKTLDLIVSIFEKEHETYKQADGNSVYFGHPLLDIVKPTMSRNEARKSLCVGECDVEIRKEAPIIALCPGSRTQEIEGLLPILLKAGELIKKEISKAEFIIPAASTEMIKKIFKYIGDDFRPKAVIGQTYDILNAADLAICASGTINLEASILGTPNIMVYKLSPLTYLVGKYVLKIGEKLKYFSMPNLLLDERAIPELVMERAEPKTISQEALSIILNKERQNKMKASFDKLRVKLGQPGVIGKVAREILNTRT